MMKPSREKTFGCRENFTVYQKPVKTMKVFSFKNFVIIGMPLFRGGGWRGSLQHSQRHSFVSQKYRSLEIFNQVVVKCHQSQSG